MSGFKNTLLLSLHILFLRLIDFIIYLRHAICKKYDFTKKIKFTQEKYHDRLSITAWNYVIQQMSLVPLPFM